MTERRGAPKAHMNPKERMLSRIESKGQTR
jgi:hypothetical protein